MSLWEKWEREKLEKMGFEVERKSDVDIRDTRPKADVRKQTLVVGASILACLLVVYFFWVLHAMYGGNWSDFSLLRIISGRMEERIAERNQ